MASKSKMPTNISVPIDAIHEFVQQVIQTELDRKKSTVEHLMKTWNKEDTKEQFLNVIKEQLTPVIADLKKSLKPKKRRKPKDPEAPKGAKTAYIIWCGDKREEVKKEHPDMKAPQILKELGRIWKEEVDDKTKEKYGKKADKDKKRYEKDMKSYEPSEEYLEKVRQWEATGGESPRAKRKPKDPEAPKGAKSAYIIWSGDKRDEIKNKHPEMKAREIAKELGRVWKEEVSEKTKERYKKKAEKDKKRYEKDMESYEPSEEFLAKVEEWKANGGEEKKRGGRKGNSNKPKKDPNAPKNARSAYLLFCSEMREQVKTEHPEFEAKEVTIELARMWKEDYADDENRERWVKMAQKDKRRYEKEMRNYHPEGEEDEDEELPPMPPSPKLSPKAKKEKPKEESKKNKKTKSKTNKKEGKSKRKKKVKATVGKAEESDLSDEELE